MISVSQLPTLNAILNSLCAILLICGYWMIRQGKVAVHKTLMISAFVTSMLFLTSYLIYHYHHLTTRFQGTGFARTVYFGILITHTILAAFVPFLAIVTLFRAWKGNFEKHRRIARWTLPIWLYVSITGVVVYWMLYRM
jgi:uncharacterized membrane protein YozB (DUF420 family)